MYLYLTFIKIGLYDNMCLNPTLIKNVNHFNRLTGLNAINDNCYYLYVPCGVCSSCIALKQAFIVQRCQLESFDNNLWFCTLTYNNPSLPFLYTNGRKITYAWKRDFQNFIKMLRKYNVFGTSFRYLCVSERGSENHRPHWHIIFSTPKLPNQTYSDILDLETRLWNDILKYWRRNYGSTRKPIWRPLLTYKCIGTKRNYDFHYINPSYSVNGENDVAFYVTKYCLKFDDYEKNLKSALYFNLSNEEFKKIWSIVKSHMYLSKGFGDVKNPKVQAYVDSCINSSKDDNSLYPYFVNPVTGQTFPLSPYLRNKFMSLDDAYQFFEKRGALSFIDNERLSIDEVSNKINSFNNVKKLVSARNCHDDLECEDYSNLFKYVSPTVSIKILKQIEDITPNLIFNYESV